MNNSKAFGSVLARIRKELGFSSAHQFYNSVGGKKSLGFSLMTYWNTEHGKKLPRSWRLKAIIAALGVEQDSPRGQELIRAYFKALSGSDELLDSLAVPAAAAAADADLPSRELAEAATQKALAQRTANLTLEQWKVCARDMVSFLCQYYLFNTTGWVTVRELSNATGFKPDLIRKTLRTFAARGIAEFTNDKARSEYAAKVVELLPATPATAPVKAALLGHLEKWMKKAGRVDTRRITIRMSRANLDIYRQHMDKFVELAAIYADSGENRHTSAVYMVDAGIFQMLP
ncbi:MAG: hypothetical protein WCK76_12150, partial [Elusimicrobiota bacterium]